MKPLLIASFVLLALFSSAQKEGNIWYFGYNAGVDFNGEEPEALLDSEMYTWEGCASVSDFEGNLLFYTNGIKVWNANHEVMPNGNYLNGHDSSSQSAVIVKKPGPNLIYMIFTLDAFSLPNGFQYSEVDMGLEGGLGDVNEVKNIPVVAPTSEKLVAIQHASNESYWILVHPSNSFDFHAYELTEFGLDMTPVISTTDVMVGSNFGAIGYMRASPNGNKIAMAKPNTILWDFDDETGIVSNPLELMDDDSYGVEFSSNGEVLYASIEGEEGKVFQFDLLAGDSAEIADSKLMIGSGFNYGGALQLGPDQKIYHAGWNSEYLGVIADPNSLGMACDYDTAGFHMGGRVPGIGLPNFKNSVFNEAAFSYEDVCLGDSTSFRANYLPLDSVKWDFGDPLSGENNSSTAFFPTHYYQELGFYQVKLTSYIEETIDSTKTWIYIKPIPSFTLGEDTSICKGEIYPLEVNLINANYQWQDNSSENYYYVTEPGDYHVNVTQLGCSNSDSIRFEPCDPMLKMPNIFSPNGDGINDTFYPLAQKDIERFRMKIYNRWGELVFETDRISNSWNGNKNGIECSEGVYFYVLYFKGIDRLEYSQKGTVTLTR